MTDPCNQTTAEEWAHYHAELCRILAQQGGKWGQVYQRIADDWDRIIEEKKTDA